MSRLSSRVITLTKENWNYTMRVTTSVTKLSSVQSECFRHFGFVFTIHEISPNFEQNSFEVLTNFLRTFPGVDTNFLRTIHEFFPHFSRFFLERKRWQEERTITFHQLPTRLSKSNQFHLIGPRNHSILCTRFKLIRLSLHLDTFKIQRKFNDSDTNNDLNE